MLKSFFQKILSLLFPSKCLGCKKEDEILCEICISILPQTVRSPDPTIIPIFRYKNIVIKNAVWALKYHSNKEIGRILAQTMYDRMLGELSVQKIFSNFHTPLLIPIPLSKKRLRNRGFNQAEVIGKEIFRIDGGISFSYRANVLYKIKDTPNQVSIKDKGERLRNLRGCFSVANTNAIKDKNIILIDDVTTTGATITEARKTLLAAGAKKVIAFTIAH